MGRVNVTLRDRFDVEGTYYSAYDDAALRAVAGRLRAANAPAWCNFDNTAHDAPTANALDSTCLLGAV